MKIAFLHPEKYVGKPKYNFEDLSIDQVCFPHRFDLLYWTICKTQEILSWRYKGNVKNFDWSQ